jgi:hypothetical protein
MYYYPTNINLTNVEIFLWRETTLAQKVNGKQLITNQCI